MDSKSSRIIKTLVPSLVQMCQVQVAVPLFQNFDDETLKRAFTEIRHEHSASSMEGSPGTYDSNCERAIAILLDIPPFLRNGVSQATESLHSAVLEWQFEHAEFHDLEYGNSIFYWKSDGTLDRIKTAERLIRKPNISIVNKFKIACMYCFEDSVKALWTEMELSGQTKNVAVMGDTMVNFWIRRILNESRVPFTEDLLSLESWSSSIKSYTSVLPKLNPRYRKEFLFACLKFAKDDDLRSCLWSVTKEEEELMLQRNVKKFLYLHLNWQMQSMFIETVKKLMKYMEEKHYKMLVDYLLCSNKIFKDLEYAELLEDLWDVMPPRMKECIRGCTRLGNEIEAFFRR